jgi:flagellar protein FliO/FliZ
MIRRLQVVGLLGWALWAAPAAHADAPPAETPKPAPAVAQPAPIDPFAVDPLTPEPEPDFGLGAAALRGLVALGIVLALIYIILKYGLRRLMGGAALPIGNRAVVSIVERIPLDAKRSLMLVKAAGEYLLVGTGDAGMSLIAKLDSEAVEKLQKERPPATPILTPFLQKLLARRSAPPPAGPEGAP